MYYKYYIQLKGNIEGEFTLPSHRFRKRMNAIKGGNTSQILKPNNVIYKNTKLFLWRNMWKPEQQQWSSLVNQLSNVGRGMRKYDVQRWSLNGREIIKDAKNNLQIVDCVKLSEKG